MEVEERKGMLLKWTTEHGMTLGLLAESVGVSQSSLSNFLKRQYTATEKQVIFWKKIEKLTGLDLDIKNPVKKKQELDLPEYIESMLKVYGNTVIPEKIIRCYGESRIIDYFANKGINCKMKVESDVLNHLYHYLEVIKRK